MPQPGSSALLCCCRSTGPSAAEDAQAIETVQLRDISERVTALRERGFTASALRQGLQHALEGYGKSRSRKGANAEAGTTMEVERVLGSIIKASSGGVDLCRHDPSLPSLYANSEHTEAGESLLQPFTTLWDLRRFQIRIVDAIIETPKSQI